MILNTSFQPLLAQKVSLETSADSLMGIPLWVTLSFSLAAFKILSLSLFCCCCCFKLFYCCSITVVCIPPPTTPPQPQPNLSLSLILDYVIMMCLGVFLLGSNFFGTLSFLDFLEVYFLCQIGEILLHYFFK